MNNQISTLVLQVKQAQKQYKRGVITYKEYAATHDDIQTQLKGIKAKVETALEEINELS